MSIKKCSTHIICFEFYSNTTFLHIHIMTENTGNLGPSVYLTNRNYQGNQLQENLSKRFKWNESPYTRAMKDDKYTNNEDNELFSNQISYMKMKKLEENIVKDVVSGKNSLHRSIAPILKLAKLIALLPVQGTTSRNTSYLVFNWFSWTVIYVVIVLTSTFLILSLSFYKVYQTGLTYYSTVNIVFFGSSLVIYILFVQLAKEWPNIMRKWELAEREMRQFGHPLHTALKFKLLTSLIMVLAIFEHIASILKVVDKAINCSTDSANMFRVYFAVSFNQVYSVVNFSWFIALPIVFLNLIITCAWNFMDLFIIILSCALADRFKQLNQRLALVKGKVLPSTYWRKSRETYNLLASLTRDFDEFLSPVILLSFANNLYFICLQLFNSLKPMHNVWEALYFVYSFSYLVGRTCAVSLYAASINDESKIPKYVLFSVPSESYCVEVSRFITQVTSDELALTGYRFFSVTRTLMLTVAGTIVTYEIVLVQFNSVTNDVIQQNNTLDCP
ncbi:gustatory receptor for sugar taste 64f [Daktulosphaira vitifoliae]|uniref:gustatory receptor for sugar taste 64f n=1 Tax=Daktulosphaira vitifoliae TaxID=58002 RepID=UPI0021AAA9D4|nr:gustatory receptor for sugar taste 64f [Daktulosphaira vitifoliae]